MTKPCRLDSVLRLCILAVEAPRWSPDWQLRLNLLGGWRTGSANLREHLQGRHINQLIRYGTSKRAYLEDICKTCNLSPARPGINEPHS